MTSSQQPFIPYNEKGLAMTEEEVNAEIERVQQRITSNLQQIDDNYVKANQMLASKLLPALEKFEQASGDIWDRSKPWVSFFESLVNTQNIKDDDTETASTHRPSAAPFVGDHTLHSARSGVSWRVLNYSETSSLHIPSGQQQALPPHTTTTTGQGGLMNSPFTPDTSPVSGNDDFQMSPPRTLPQRISPSSLMGTPRDEAASILTNNTLRSIGVNSSDSDSTGGQQNPFQFKKPTGRPSQAPQQHTASTSSNTNPTTSTNSTTPSKKGKEVRAWEVSDMDTEDPEGKEKFEKFFASRQQKFKSMPQDLELATMRSPARSPSSRAPFSYDLLANTPTMERVMHQKQLDLRSASATPASKRSRHEDGSNHGRREEEEERTSRSNTSRREVAESSNPLLSSNRNMGTNRRRMIVEELDNVEIDLDEVEEEARTHGFKSPAQFMHLQSPMVHQQQQQQSVTEAEEEEGAAYLFSDILAPQQDDSGTRNQSLGTFSSAVTEEEENRTSSSFKTSDITMKSGQSTALIPAQFNLRYFPQAFQAPPGSTRLTRVYHVFEERPGEMLTIENVVETINDLEYHADLVKVLVDILAGKKFLKKVGQHNAWVVRR